MLPHEFWKGEKYDANFSTKKKKSLKDNASNVFFSWFLFVYCVCLYFNNASHLHEGKIMLT